MSELYIGLMSGTSMDAIDAVLAEFGDRSVRLVHALKHDYPEPLRKRLAAAIVQPVRCGVDELGELDAWVGQCFRDAALGVMAATGIGAPDVRAIGSHGQTLRHRPDAEHRFTMQIGDPSLIASGAGVATIADFRRADVALGGEGAPLVPPFHAWLFADDRESRAVVNIGGIANVTVLPKGSGAVTGFDTGPGNALLDGWIRAKQDVAFDEDGRWSAGGRVDRALLTRLANDPWFRRAPPKSTGVEYFNLDWLQTRLDDDADARDVQATLAELSASTIADAIRRFAADTARVLVCGGGAHNVDLQRRLAAALGGIAMAPTSSFGLDPDWVEAAAFAWLAKRHVEGLPGNLPTVTGASRAAILGACYPAPPTAQS